MSSLSPSLSAHAERRSTSPPGRRVVRGGRFHRRVVVVTALVAAFVAPLPLGPAEHSGGAVAADDPPGIEIIEFETVRNQHVVLGSLASRTLQKPVSISGISPTFTVRGTDSITNQPYEFVTDFFYNPDDTAPGFGSDGFARGLAWANEGDERALESDRKSVV